MGCRREHYALLGMATVAGGYPLFYDAVNEHGLAMAGLNFPQNAFYGPERADKDNVSSFEFIPWLLCRCKTEDEARSLLARLQLAAIPFSEQMPLAPLHWQLSDREQSLVIEARADGLHIHENPVGVMTNNPPFEHQLFSLNNCRHRDRVCQEVFCNFSKFNKLFVKKPPATSCLHISSKTFSIGFLAVSDCFTPTI